MVDFDNLLFRASSFGYLMVEPSNTKKEYYVGDLEISAQKYNSLIEKAVLAQNLDVLKSVSTKTVATGETLSESTKTHLIDIYVSEVLKRREEIDNKFLRKGNEREEAAITLLSRVNKVFYKKNTEHLRNSFTKGIPDLYTGNIITNAEKIKDTKVSWSAFTFHRAKKGELLKLYYWQIMCYLWLTGAKSGWVSYCLVNGTHKAITDEKMRLARSMDLLDPSTSEEYKERCKQIEINHIFDLEEFRNEYPFYEFDNDLSDWHYDIPIHQRVHEIEVVRDEAKIEKMKNRVIECREWMKKNFN